MPLPRAFAVGQGTRLNSILNLSLIIPCWRREGWEWFLTLRWQRLFHSGVRSQGGSSWLNAVGRTSSLESIVTDACFIRPGQECRSQGACTPALQGGVLFFSVRPFQGITAPKYHDLIRKYEQLRFFENSALIFLTTRDEFLNVPVDSRPRLIQSNQLHQLIPLNCAVFPIMQVFLSLLEWLPVRNKPHVER